MIQGHFELEKLILSPKTETLIPEALILTKKTATLPAERRVGKGRDQTVVYYSVFSATPQIYCKVVFFLIGGRGREKIFTRLFHFETPLNANQAHTPDLRIACFLTKALIRNIPSERDADQKLYPHKNTNLMKSEESKLYKAVAFRSKYMAHQNC